MKFLGPDLGLHRSCSDARTRRFRVLRRRFQVVRTSRRAEERAAQRPPEP
jgi:hypothetical protein